jgi:hypothetical protein
MCRALSAAVVIVIASATPVLGQPVPLRKHAVEQKAPPGSLSRMDGVLRRMVVDAQTAKAAGRAPDDAGGGARTAVTIRLRSGDAAENPRGMLARFGVVPANEAGRVIEAYVPIAALDALARQPEVEALEAIVPPMMKVTSQGVTVHNASNWQTAGRSGSNVRVGIIDGGFVGFSSRVGVELPFNTLARCYTSLGTFTSALADCETGTVHGTGVAEAVADMAPGVRFYIANPQSPLDLRSTVDWMISQGVQVINHSVGWTWTGPGDGTTPFADAPLRSVDAAVAGGAVWVNAAGNEGRATWSEAYREFTSAGCRNCLEFSPGTFANGIALRAGERLIMQVRWDDSWTAAARDLDIYLMDAAGNVLDGGIEPQDGRPGGIPFEVFSFTAPAQATYYVWVERFSGTAPAWVDVQAFSGQSLQFATDGHSIANPAETGNPGALAVGAVPWFETTRLETFSSRGPTRDGRLKPDLVAADRGDSVTYGPGGFAGTSQASPHVAGLAALVLGEFSGTSPHLVATYLRTLAVPRGGGPNTFFGMGLAQVPQFPSTASVTALLTLTTFPIEAGVPARWTAFGLGADGPVEYKFWEYRDGGGWRLLRDYATSHEITWTPPLPGTYNLQVWVRRVGSLAAYEDWRGTAALIVAGTGPALSVSPPTVDAALPVRYGTTVTWTAQATGGAPPVMYQWWRLKQGVGWSLAQDYSTSNTFSWTPTASDAGIYQLQVWVRGAGSTAAYDAWAGFPPFEVLGPRPPRITALLADVPFPAVTGQPITWSASVENAALEPYEYAFWRYKQGAGWTLARAYAPGASFTWTPGPGDTGTYAIQVWVRRVGATAAYEDWRGSDLFDVRPPPAARLTGLGQSPSGTVTAGTAITWVASAVDGVPPRQFRFWLYSNGSWSLLQDYSPASSVTWTPTTPGTYAVQVWVRSHLSTASYEDWAGTPLFSVTAAPAPFVSRLSANVPFPATVGTTLTLTASAGGGAVPLEYQFWRYREGAGWSLVQGYGPLATYSWTPVAGEEGTYAVQVWVRSTGSAARYEAWLGTPLFSVAAAGS